MSEERAQEKDGEPMTDGEAHVLSPWAFSASRIWVLAQNTFLQLVRMRVFYFLLVFAALILVVAAAGLFWKPLDQLLSIKRWSFGAMYVFSMVYSISATALLLPRDLEDRTLYTILSKPVPRLEYLAGRLLGVILINGAALLAMFLAMTLLILWKMPAVEQQFMNELMVEARGEAVSAADIAQQKALAREQGVTLSLFWGLWALFLKASVISAVTLFISTFASSSLFTIVTGAMVTFIGHFHQVAMNYWSDQVGGATAVTLVSSLLAIVFPNLAMFDVIDEIITGAGLAFGQAMKLTGLGLFYVVFYGLLAQLVFVDKEL